MNWDQRWRVYMTHKRQDCLERPRKKGAKFTNRDIAADEVVQDVATGYDAKRDRWNGYDPSEHKKVYEEYEAIEAERQRQREAGQAKNPGPGGGQPCQPCRLGCS